MGSGETSPTMVKTHRAVLERVGGPSGGAVVLDTPVGFQENADELSAKAVEYFRESVGAPLAVASFRSAATASAVELETMLARLRDASYVFAGPGSPSYALRQWKGTAVHDILADKLRPGGPGGAVVFASAAALTLGRWTIPVYEIYKVGADVEWLDGLDLVAATGLGDCAVVPHWNNAEGGTHDTRYCYMGERRLRVLESQLPADAFVLGVDEHTGCILDLDARTASVVGNGAVYVRRPGGETTSFASGETVAFDALLHADTSRTLRGFRPVEADSDEASAGRSPFLDDVDRLDADAGAAFERRDANAVTEAILGLEDLVAEWSTETFSGDEMDRARRTLRGLVVRLGDAATAGLRDPRHVVGPYVDALLAARADLRRAKQYDAADALRDRLVGIGVEVRDTPAGAEWELRP
jgi:cyanophycinase-like exopeptidase